MSEQHQENSNHHYHEGHCHHHHHHHQIKNLKRLSFVLVITVLYMFAEFFGGYFTNSLALMADAGHMLGDVASLILSFVTIWLASQHAPANKSFGYFRGEIIAALINGLTLILIAGMIVYEAYHRFTNVETVTAGGMLMIALGGLVVNIAGAKILHEGSEENLNVKGAYLHILADLLGSIGAITAGVLMYFFKWYLADPIISCVIAVLVLYSSFGIIKSAFDILMEGVPEDIDIDSVHKSLEQIDGVKEIHDLHIWGINANIVSLTVHLVTEQDNYKELLTKANCLLKEKYGISHSTIQVEPVNFSEDSCLFN